jgi:hypothetical protein
MLETLRKKAEDFAIHEASKKATDEMMEVIKPYVVGEMKKMGAEFEKMAKYINSVENESKSRDKNLSDKLDKLTAWVKQIEKGKTKEGEL